MNWKRVVLFIFLILLGIVLLAFYSVLVFSWFSLLFFVAYVVFLYLIFKEYSKKRLITLFVIFLIYLAIMLIPFSKCDSSGGGIIKDECTCIGIKKHFSFIGGSWSECVGIPVNYRTNYPQLMKNSLLDDLENSNKSLNFPYQIFVLKTSERIGQLIGIKNTADVSKNFLVSFKVKGKGGDKLLPFESTDDLSWNLNDGTSVEARIDWDDSTQTLGAGDTKVIPFTIIAPDKTGDYLYKVILTDEDLGEEFAETFFVKVNE